MKKLLLLFLLPAVTNAQPEVSVRYGRAIQSREGSSFTTYKDGGNLQATAGYRVKGLGVGIQYDHINQLMYHFSSKPVTFHYLKVNPLNSVTAYCNYRVSFGAYIGGRIGYCNYTSGGIEILKTGAEGSKYRKGHMDLTGSIMIGYSKSFYKNLGLSLQGEMATLSVPHAGSGGDIYFPITAGLYYKFNPNAAHKQTTK